MGMAEGQGTAAGGSPLAPPPPGPESPGAGAWAPLRTAAFRTVWIASLVSNVGTWMQSASAAWFMTSLSSSPVMVALMPAATSLPFVLLALPAGALADIVDRRRLLIAAQLWMLIAAAALGGLTVAGRTTDWLLLGLTAALGIGAAMMAPAWQAFAPHLVPRQHLPAAVALGGVSLNVARAVGPALGGLLLAIQGPGPVFLVNAASFIVVIAALAMVRDTRRASTLPPERVVGAISAGVRYVRHARPLRSVLLRTAAFMLPGSGLWALLPLVARHDLGLSAVGYGLLLGCLGAGAIGAAWGLPTLRRALDGDQIVAGATVVFAAAMLVLGTAHVVPVVAVAMLIGGGAWIAATATLMGAAQGSVPAWVRARALAVVILVLQGGIALGSVLWGAVATRATTQSALLAGAAVMLASLAVTRGARLRDLGSLDLSPVTWPDPELHVDIDPERVPVLIMVEYEVGADDANAFVATMREVSDLRRRDGATEWGLFRDAARPSRFVETFLAPSWLEHLRQHERSTEADRVLRDRIAPFVLRERQPVSHLIAVDV
ncbi:MAG: MFS transporter [Candidatus Binatia bacterium]